MRTDLVRLLAAIAGIVALGGTAVAAAGKRPWESYRDVILKWCAHYSIPPRLLIAIGMHESRFNPRAVNFETANDSKTGRDNDSIGIMQILYPATATKLKPGITRDALFDADLNIGMGAQLLDELIGRYGAGSGFPSRVVSAYNAGRPIAGNATYVEKVRAQWDLLEGVA